MAKKPRLRTAGVIGGGAWGTALAQTLRFAGLDVMLWARDPDVVAGINRRHRNDKRLPSIDLDPQLRATNDLADAAGGKDLLLLAVPSREVPAVGLALRPHLHEGQELIICAKGFIPGERLVLTGAVLDACGVLASVLSGPSFADEVARGLPAAVTLAAFTLKQADRLGRAVGHKHFRLYYSEDLGGVQIGGAVKNVLAIAAGILVGRRLGASAHAALVTRGFSELCRLGRYSRRIRPETLNGLSCLGDLILTCSSPRSRNFSFGRHLGEGRTVTEALRLTGTVEGASTAELLTDWAREIKVDMPISAAVQRVVSGAIGVDQAIDELLERPHKAE